MAASMVEQGAGDSMSSCGDESERSEKEADEEERAGSACGRSHHPGIGGGIESSVWKRERLASAQSEERMSPSSSSKVSGKTPLKSFLDRSRENMDTSPPENSPPREQKRQSRQYPPQMANKSCDPTSPSALQVAPVYTSTPAAKGKLKLAVTANEEMEDDSDRGARLFSSVVKPQWESPPYSTPLSPPTAFYSQPRRPLHGARDGQESFPYHSDSLSSHARKRGRHAGDEETSHPCQGQFESILETREVAPAADSQQQRRSLVDSVLKDSRKGLIARRGEVKLSPLSLSRSRSKSNSKSTTYTLLPSAAGSASSSPSAKYHSSLQDSKSPPPPPPAVAAAVPPPNLRCALTPQDSSWPRRGLSENVTPIISAVHLNPDLWTTVPRGAECDADDCLYRDAQRLSLCKHYHAHCDHRHQNGAKMGMRFHHHQMEKVKKHQRSHNNTKSQMGSNKVDKRLCETPEHDGGGGSADTASFNEGVASDAAPVQALAEPNWTKLEDQRLEALVERLGQNWTDISEQMGSKGPKECHERYVHCLFPSLKMGAWNEDEENILIRLHNDFHDQWSEIARRMPGRTDMDVKNHWALLMRHWRSLMKYNTAEAWQGEGMA